MIQAYINEIVRHLPFKQRKEVAMELNSNIYEALGDNPSDETILRFLKEMGEPIDIAQQYMETQYLIGPKYFGKYQELLFLVAKIALPVIFILSIFSSLLSPTFQNIGKTMITAFASAEVPLIISSMTLFIIRLFYILATSLTSLITGAITLFAIITLIFAILERRESKIDILPFDFDTLKKQEKETPKMSVFIGGIFTIFGALILSTLIFMPALIGIYDLSGRVTPFFNIMILKGLFPLITLSIMVTLINGVVKMIYREENRIVISADIISSVILLVLIVTLMNTPNLVNPEFIHIMENKFIFDFQASRFFDFLLNNFKLIFMFIIGLNVFTILHNVYKLMSQS